MPFTQNGEWRLLFFVRLAIELSIAGSQAAVGFSGGLANVDVVVAVARDHLEEGRESAFLALASCAVKTRPISLLLPQRKPS